MSCLPPNHIVGSKTKFGGTSAPAIEPDAIDDAWSKGLVALLIRRGEVLAVSEDSQTSLAWLFSHTA